MQLIRGNRRAALVSAREPWPRSLACDPLARHLRRVEECARRPYERAARFVRNVVEARLRVTLLLRVYDRAYSPERESLVNPARAETFYFKELERRRDIDAAPTFRVAALALLGGIMSSYLSRFTIDGTPMAWFFLISSGGVIVFSTLAVIWIVRLFVGFTWGYIPCPDELQAHFDALRRYNEEHGLDSGTPEETFDAYLKTCFIDAASRNMRNNNARSELLYRASFFIAVAVLFTLIAGVPVLYRALGNVALIQ
jgi:hypothetical protein